MSTSRQPKGIPTGGQFAPSAHSDAPSLLPSDPLYVAPEPTVQKTEGTISEVVASVSAVVPSTDDDGRPTGYGIVDGIDTGRMPYPADRPVYQGGRFVGAPDQEYHAPLGSNRAQRGTRNGGAFVDRHWIASDAEHADAVLREPIRREDETSAPVLDAEELAVVSGLRARAGGGNFVIDETQKDALRRLQNRSIVSKDGELTDFGQDYVSNLVGETGWQMEAPGLQVKRRGDFARELDGNIAAKEELDRRSHEAIAAIRSEVEERGIDEVSTTPERRSLVDRIFGRSGR